MTDFGRRVAVAEANVLPKTGQTTSYVDYDDGYYEKGWTDTERFTDNGDGTVTDNATGLIWVKDFAGAGANNGAYITWQGAIDFAEALDFAGHQDWRLPNILELFSIADFEAVNPTIYSIFDNLTWDSIWSSTTSRYNTSYAWTLDTWEARLFATDKTSTYILVLPVRKA